MGSRRSVEQVQDRLNQESAWRKRELGTLRLLIQRARPHEKELLQRAAVALAYAHWEGFFKNAIDIVLEYLSRQGLKLSDVNSGLLSRGVERLIRDAAAARKHAPMVAVVELLRSDLRSECRIDRSVSTKANLNSEVLEDLLTGLGLDAARIFNAERGVTDLDLDERLLGRRNRIAHGEYVVPDAEECGVLILAVDALMDAATTVLVTYLSHEEYRDHPIGWQSAAPSLPS